MTVVPGGPRIIIATSRRDFCIAGSPSTCRSTSPGCSTPLSGKTSQQATGSQLGAGVIRGMLRVGDARQISDGAMPVARVVGSKAGEDVGRGPAADEFLVKPATR